MTRTLRIYFLNIPIYHAEVLTTGIVFYVTSLVLRYLLPGLLFLITMTAIVIVNMTLLISYKAFQILPDIFLDQYYNMLFLVFKYFFNKLLKIMNNDLHSTLVP